MIVGLEQWPEKNKTWARSHK